MTDPLKTGDVIGILGGGQLGRMLSVAASRLGLRTHIFEPAPNSPAADVAHRVTTASYDDERALVDFAKSVNVVTYEFENIPTSALDILEQHRVIRPGREALRVSQDRLIEKTFLNELGLTTAPFVAVNSVDSLAKAMTDIGTPAILKTRRFGYDGKGQLRLGVASDPSEVWQQFEGQETVLEGFVDFSHEVSVIGARSIGGDIACFDPGENVHQNGILHTTTLPARLSASQRTDAILLTAKIMTALDYIGVMGVELFVTASGLIVNEIAPRVHNSGHWTQNGCAVDQFEQHIRAVAQWPLGDGSRHSNVVMENLIGDDIERAETLSKAPHVALHLYGKTEVKPGRKMGHFNRISAKD
jgi:5-(carboxyamino)imidazole ribonucleotide synthase